MCPTSNPMVQSNLSHDSSSRTLKPHSAPYLLFLKWRLTPSTIPQNSVLCHHCDCFPCDAVRKPHSPLAATEQIRPIPPTPTPTPASWLGMLPLGVPLWCVHRWHHMQASWLTIQRRESWFGSTEHVVHPLFQASDRLQALCHFCPAWWQPLSNILSPWLTLFYPASYQSPSITAL